MINFYLRALLTFVIVIPLIANASDTLVKPGNYSGFLKDYSQLQQAKDEEGHKVMRYLSPALTSGQYHQVMIDPVKYYPMPKPDKNVDSATLDSILHYFDKTLNQKVGEQVLIVNKAGPGVVRLRIALTAVKTENAPLKPYQYIPFAFIAHGIRKAAGDNAKDAELYVEMDVLDSQSGKRIGAVVAKSAGTEVKAVEAGPEKGKKMVVLDNVKPILDNWAKMVADFAGSNFHPQ